MRGHQGCPRDLTLSTEIQAGGSVATGEDAGASPGQPEWPSPAWWSPWYRGHGVHASQPVPATPSPRVLCASLACQHQFCLENWAHFYSIVSKPFGFISERVTRWVFPLLRAGSSFLSLPWAWRGCQHYFHGGRLGYNEISSNDSIIIKSLHYLRMIDINGKKTMWKWIHLKYWSKDHGKIVKKKKKNQNPKILNVILSRKWNI